MALKQTIEAYELLDAAEVTAAQVAAILRKRGAIVEVQRLEAKTGSTDVIKAVVVGTRGRQVGSGAPTLGVIGTLGGVGARPARIGLVSDADGAITAVATALKLADMASVGDRLAGDVVIATHISTAAPMIPHDPVPFMTAPVPVGALMTRLVDDSMDALLSVDTTRGNRILNARGMAITPTVKEGYILRISEDLLDLAATVTGRLPHVLPVTAQDVTPYGNGLHHVNSILQPATVTVAPLVGVALTAEVVVPGTATGASQAVDIEQAVRFCVEVAKGFGEGWCRFYDPEEFRLLVRLYGSMRHFQNIPNLEPPSH